MPRTIRSALANMVGLYSEGSVADQDYPSKGGWPKGYVPVPIHTMPPDSDAVGWIPEYIPSELSVLLGIRISYAMCIPTPYQIPV